MIIEIENCFNLKKRIEFYSKYLEDFNFLVEDLKKFFKEWEKVILDENGLFRNYFLSLDNEKLNFLE